MMNSSSASLDCSLHESAFNSHCFASTDTQNTAIREEADFQWPRFVRNEEAGVRIPSPEDEQAASTRAAVACVV
jgi:hypothetical protein